MSKVTEMVDEEATKAEAEQSDDDTPDEDQPEGDEPESLEAPEPTPSTDPTDADMKAFQQEHARHERALVKIMGDDFALLVPCAECGSMGYRPPDQLKTHTKYIACETCNGFGQVLTGSKAAGNETQACPVCAGRGFLEKMPEQPAGNPIANGETQAQPQYGTPAWMGNPDMTPSPYVAPPVT